MPCPSSIEYDCFFSPLNEGVVAFISAPTLKRLIQHIASHNSAIRSPDFASNPGAQHHIFISLGIKRSIQKP